MGNAPVLIVHMLMMHLSSQCTQLAVAMETCHLAAAYSCYRDNISRGVTYRLAVIGIITLQKKEEVLQCAEGTLCPERCDASI